MDVDSLHNTRSQKLKLAATLCDRRHPAEAIACLRALLADDPEDLDALALLGEAQLADHDPDGALITATTALGLEPNRELPHRQASIAASRRGLHRDAIAHAEEAVRLAPGDHRGFVALARALLRSKRDLEQARRAAIRAMVIARDEAEPHLVFGMVARAEGEFAAAEASFRRATQLDPGNVAAHHELARLRVRKDTLDQRSRPAQTESASGAAPPEAWPVPSHGIAARMLRSVPALRGPRMRDA
jgi:Flp pilus assembly protein TadD